MSVVIETLLEAHAYPHPVHNMRTRETHISWILLTGDYAYKIKKPVQFSFLDFSTLTLRRHYCNEELQLNRRFAPHLYLDIVGIYGSEQRPTFTGDGQPIEYAVKMRQFPDADRLDQRLNNGELSTDLIDECAAYIFSYYNTSESVHDAGFGDPCEVVRPVMGNFQVITPSALASSPVRELQTWCAYESQRLLPYFAQRKEEGYIRQLHGDLHLGNMVYFENQVLAFDCIEFDAQLRYIDIVNEISFLFMDLLFNARPDLAYRFLNRFLEYGGDYAGLTLLKYYTVYHALVRAKINVLTLRELQGSAAKRQQQHLQRHLELAHSLTQQSSGGLIIMCGLAGSGKSTVAERLMEQLPAIRIRSDVERKRMHKMAPTVNSESAINHGIYGAQATRRLYSQLEEYVELLSKQQFVVILDAAFLQPTQRRHFRQLAQRLDIPFAIVWCDADANTLRNRVNARDAQGSDPSEADIKVLEYQLRHASLPNSDADTSGMFRFNTTGDADTTKLSSLLSAHMGYREPVPSTNEIV